MSIDKMREEFDSWHHTKYCLLISYGEPTAAAHCMSLKSVYWDAWYASRKAIEVELPMEDGSRCDNVAEEAKQEAYNRALEECRCAIESLGMRVKP